VDWVYLAPVACSYGHDNEYSDIIIRGQSV
jgi:hypothetical protein